MAHAAAKLSELQNCASTLSNLVMTSRNRLASSTPIGNMLLRKMLPNALPLFVRQPNLVLIIRLAVPGEDLHDFYPGGGRDDNMIGFFNAHDCKVTARLVVSIHKGPIEASCYEWDPFEHELGEKFSETSRPDS